MKWLLLSIFALALSGCGKAADGDIGVTAPVTGTRVIVTNPQQRSIDYSLTALGTVGINVSALVAGLGLTGFAVGFAFKDTLSNILSGVLILLYRPFIIGDKIKIADFEGEVISIDLRYTTLNAETGRVLIPNSKCFTDPVTVLKKD